MVGLVLSLMLLVAQAAPAAPAPPPAPAPAPAPAADASAPPSARLEGILAGLKGKPKAAFTAKLGPADRVRPATDGEVLIWMVKSQGETVCGAGPGGGLVCGRQGDGDCMVVAAFSKADTMTLWRSSGVVAACEKAADMLLAPAVAAPKYKSGR